VNRNGGRTITGLMAQGLHHAVASCRLFTVRVY
jgi:hypothetical protein